MKRICLVLSEDFKKEIDDLAKKKNISTNAFVRFVLSEYIKNNK